MRVIIRSAARPDCTCNDFQLRPGLEEDQHVEAFLAISFEAWKCHNPARFSGDEEAGRCGGLPMVGHGQKANAMFLTCVEKSGVVGMFILKRIRGRWVANIPERIDL